MRKILPHQNCLYPPSEQNTINRYDGELKGLHGATKGRICNLHNISCRLHVQLGNTEKVKAAYIRISVEIMMQGF